MTQPIKRDNNNLAQIVNDATKKGFVHKEIEVIKTVYDMAMSEYVAHNPYSVYRENAVHDRMYFQNQRTYAAAKAREYIIRTIDEWHKVQGDETK